MTHPGADRESADYRALHAPAEGESSVRWWRRWLPGVGDEPFVDPGLAEAIRAEAGNIDPTGYQFGGNRLPRNPYLMLANLAVLAIAAVWFFFAMQDNSFLLGLGMLILVGLLALAWTLLTARCG